MSAHVSHRHQVNGGSSPNSFPPVLTVDLRVFWPPYTVSVDDVMEALYVAVVELRAQVQAKAWEPFPGSS